MALMACVMEVFKRFTFRLFYLIHLWLMTNLYVFFTAMCHDSMVYAKVMCLSQIAVLLKWLNVGSRKQCHTIAQVL